MTKWNKLIRLLRHTRHLTFMRKSCRPLAVTSPGNVRDSCLKCCRLAAVSTPLINFYAFPTPPALIYSFLRSRGTQALPESRLASYRGDA